MRSCTNEICKRCAKENKHTCCNSISGGFSPQQLGLKEKEEKENESKIITLLNSGIVTINDSSERRAPFIKPRNFSEFEYFHNSIVKYTVDTDRLSYYPDMKVMDCIFLGANGCVLTKKMRPYQCVHKLAKPENNCPLERGIYTINDLWEPYEMQLRRIIDKIKNETIQINPVRVAANYVDFHIQEEYASEEEWDEDMRIQHDMRKKFLLGYSELNLDEVKKLIVSK